MAKKATPQAWNLSVDHVSRRIIFTILNVVKPNTRKEGKELTRALDALEGEDDLSQPTPAMDSGFVYRLAGMLQQHGLREDLVEQLATELKRVPPKTDEKASVPLTIDNIEAILAAYDKALGDKTLNGNDVRKVNPIIEAFEQAREGEETKGLLWPVEVPAKLTEVKPDNGASDRPVP